MTWNMFLNYASQYLFSPAPMDSVGAYSHGVVVGGSILFVGALYVISSRE